MGENILSVKITADVVDLNTKFAVAKASARDLTKEFSDLARQSAAGLLDPAGMAQLQEASRSMLEAKAAVAELKAEMSEARGESFNLGESLEEIRGKIGGAFEIAGIAAAAEGVREVYEAVEQAGQRMLEMRTSADVLNITTDQFQAMGAAAEEAGQPVDTLVKAALRLNEMLTKARDGSGEAREQLKTLGMTLEQILDPNTNVAEVLQVLHERLTDSATATSTMNELTRQLGTRAGETAEAIKKLELSHEEMAKILAKLHALTTQEINDGAEVAIKAGEAKTAMTNLWDRAILKAVEYSKVARDNFALGKSLGDALGVELPKEKNPSSDSGKIDRSATDGSGQGSPQAQAALDNEIQLQELQNIQAGVEAYKQGTAEKLAQLQILYTATVAYYGADSDKARAAEKEVIAERRAVNEESKRLADEYATSVSQTFTSIANKARESMSQAYKQIETSAAESAKTVEAAQLGAIDRQIAEVRSLAQLHQISAKAELDQTVTLLAQKWAAEQEYFNKIHALYANDPAEAAKIDQQELTAHNAYLTELTAANAKAAQQQARQWQSLTNAMQQGFATAFRGMITQGQSFGTAMKNMFVQVADAAAANAAKNLATMVAENTVSKGMRSQEIRQDAGAAAAGAYKAIVGIPYVGPFLAPAAAAVAYAGVLAFDSAEGGYDVPRGLNPMTQLHEREMVLPRQHADVIRDLADGGPGSPGRGSGGRSVNIYGSPQSVFTHDQLAKMLTELNHRFALR